MEKFTIYIPYNNRKIPVYISGPKDPDFKDMPEAVYVECEEAGFYQGRDITDIGLLTEIIPELIKRQKRLKKESVLNLRLSYEDRDKLEHLAKENGYKNVSSYARSIILQATN